MTLKPSEKADVFYVVMDASATAPTQANVLAEATYAGDKTSWIAHGKATFDGSFPSVSLSGLSAGRPKCYCATYAFQQEGKEKLCLQKKEDKCYYATGSSGTSWCLDSRYDTVNAQSNCVQVRKKVAEMMLSPFVLSCLHCKMVCLVYLVAFNYF